MISFTRRPWLFLTVLTAALAGSSVCVFFAAAAEDWKEYSNELVGIKLSVKHSWGETVFKETKDTGSVSFLVAREPHATLSIVRQKEQVPFTVWLSSTVLTQIYQPGYKKSSVEFAGRPSVKIVGKLQEKEGRRAETYYSSQASYLDEITFAAPADQWQLVEPLFANVRKSIRWTR